MSLNKFLTYGFNIACKIKIKQILHITAFSEKEF